MRSLAHVAGMTNVSIDKLLQHKRYYSSKLASPASVHLGKACSALLCATLEEFHSSNFDTGKPS